MGRWLELDSLDNQNISSALLIGTYTATADIDVYCTLYAQGLAGGGDYIYYVTVTPSGLSEGEAQKTTQTLGATTYVLFGQSIPISLRNGDVLKVYLDGLAGDTAAPDTRVNFYEGQVTALSAGAITAAAIATGAIDADALTTDAVAELADGVWDEATSGHAVAGSTGKALSDAGAAGDPWAAATRTLTQTAAQVASVLEGSTITIQRGDTLSVALTGLAANTGYVSIDFTVKRDFGNNDNEAILRIRKNASGVSDGLLRLCGAAPVSPIVAGSGSITVVSATALTIALSAAATFMLKDEDGLVYDIQYIFASSIQTATSGACSVVADITQAIT